MKTDWESFIRENLAFDPETGLLWWKVQSKNNQRVLDKPLGVSDKNGYLRVTLKSNNEVKTYLVHRLAWFLMFGEWPKVTVDHIDGDPANNKIINLRQATLCQNQANQKKRSNKTSSIYKGVYLFKRDMRWMAYINKSGKRHHLGYYDTQEDAAKVYDEAAKHLFGKFAKLNFPDKVGD